MRTIYDHLCWHPFYTNICTVGEPSAAYILQTVTTCHSPDLTRLHAVIFPTKERPAKMRQFWGGLSIGY